MICFMVVSLIVTAPIIQSRVSGRLIKINDIAVYALDMNLSVFA
jgi:hypothetical protein